MHRGAQRLIYDCHLLQKITCSGEFVDNEKRISYVEAYVPALFRIKGNIACHPFPCSVEVYTNKLTISINDRTA